LQIILELSKAMKVSNTCDFKPAGWKEKKLIRGVRK